MQILIDGDACNKIADTEKIAERRSIPCHVYCDTSRCINTSYAEVHFVDVDRDSADFALINKCLPNDIVITNDSGLAAMVLAKRAYAINTYGFEYTTRDIMTSLTKRYMRKHAIDKNGRKQVKGIMSTNRKRFSYEGLLKAVIRRARKNERGVQETNNGNESEQ